MVRRPASRRAAWATVALCGLLSACGSLRSAFTPPSASPRLRAPAVNADVQTVFPEFTWDIVTGATAYVITITPLGGAALSATTSSARYIPGAALTVGQDYTWNVSARNAGGTGPAATPRGFRVIDNTLPAAPVHDVIPGWTLGNGEAVWSDTGHFRWIARGAPGPDDQSGFELLYDDGAHMAGGLVQGPGFGPGAFLAVFLDDGRGSRLGPAPSGSMSIGVDCGADYSWRVRTFRGSLLRPAVAGLDGLVSASASGVDLTPAQSPWTDPWVFHIPQPVSQAPTLRSPANGASVNSGRLEWSHPLDPAERLDYEVQITTDRAETQQAFWVFGGPRSPSLRDADRARLSESYFPVILGRGITYSWRVRASRAEGLCSGPWSDWWSFTWTGPNEQLGSLPAPTCITDSTGACFPTPTIAPTVTRTARPTATRTPTPTSTIPGLPGPGITLLAPSPTNAPQATKTPLPTKEPPPKPTDKPTDKPKPPTEKPQSTEAPK